MNREIRDPLWIRIKLLENYQIWYTTSNFNLLNAKTLNKYQSSMSLNKYWNVNTSVEFKKYHQLILISISLQLLYFFPFCLLFLASSTLFRLLTNIEASLRPGWMRYHLAQQDWYVAHRIFKYQFSYERFRYASYMYESLIS